MSEENCDYVRYKQLGYRLVVFFVIIITIKTKNSFILIVHFILNSKCEVN